MADLSYAAKRLIMLVSMASEIGQLGLHLDRISERNRRSRDFTLASLVRAIREVIAAFPVYRTYVGDLGDEPSQRDRGYIDRAVAEAKRRNPTVNVSIFDFLRDALLLRHPERSDEQEQAERRRFAMRFQQTTGPVTAKGVEDTALYLYNRLISLNEVGGDPARYGEPLAAFHEQEREAPRALARFADLHCYPRHEAWRGRAGTHQRPVGGAGGVGGPRAAVADDQPALQARSWTVRPRPIAMTSTCSTRRWSGRGRPRTVTPPLDRCVDRIAAYMEKATKEAKRRTSWINPDAGYDQALRDFVTRLLAPRSPFRDAFLPFQRLVALYGSVNSLAQTLLKIASPGIPDFYQGSELWDLSLVDPDNRRPVDFAARQRLLDELQQRAGAGRRASRHFVRSS
mgnify:CR=1 FL=1